MERKVTVTAVLTRLEVGTFCTKLYSILYIPWKSKDYFLNGFSVKTIVFVGIYNQQFKGTILFMVFDFQGIPMDPITETENGNGT